jgi:RNA polymerase sigma-32 factor
MNEDYKTLNVTNDNLEESEENPKKTLPVPSTKGELATRDALSIYLREINRFPLLDPEEEFELARRVRDYNDQEAAFKLVSSHLRLVVKIAMDFQRKWMQNILDLLQEGNVGLMKAVQKFDPDRGIKFSYYAAFWIKAYILKFIMDNWRMVKIGTTQAQRKLFYNLSKEKQKLESEGFVPDAGTLSKHLDVSKEDVLAMSQRMGQQDMSLDSTLNDDTSATRLDFLPALDMGIEEKLAQEEISNVLQEHIKTIEAELNDKERDILHSRLLAASPITLREIGEKYGITRERVRQIEARLLQKIRKHLSNKIEDFSSEWISNE